MAVTFVNNALGGTTTTTSFSITLPATQANDIIVLEFAHRGTGNGTIGGTYTGPAFALKHDQLFASSTFSGKTYWSRATGNHNGETVTGASLTNSCAAVVTIYRGAKTGADPLADATIVGEQNASGNETQAQISNATAGAWIVLVVANSPDVAVSTQACTTPGALTERAEVLSTGGTDSSIAHASAEKAGAGGTGSFTWAQTDGASGSWAYAITPEPPPSAPIPRSRAQQAALIAAWISIPVALWTAGFAIPPEAEASVPFNRNAAASVQQWWAPPEFQPQQRRFVPQAAAAVEGKTPFKRSWLGAALDSWAPSPTLLWQNGFAIPQTDDPPFGLKPWLPGVVESWRVTWDAQTTRHVVQAAAAVAEKVPFSRGWLRALDWWQPLSWEAQDKPKAVQEAAAEQKVPFDRGRFEPIALWEPLSWEAQSARHVPPPTPDNIAFGRRPIPAAVAQAWADPTWDAQHAPRYPRGFESPVNDPPFGLKPWLPTVSLAWQQTWDAQTTRHVVQGGAAAAEKTPYSRSWRLAVDGWNEASWPAQTSRHLVQVPADSPPPSARRWLAQINLTWEPGPYPAQAGRRLAQGRPSDLPPFGLRSWQAALTQWEPAAWPAQGGPLVVQPQLLVYSSTSLRTRIGSASARDGQQRIGTETAVDGQQSIGTSTANAGNGRIGSEDA